MILHILHHHVLAHHGTEHEKNHRVEQADNHHNNQNDSSDIKDENGLMGVLRVASKTLPARSTVLREYIGLLLNSTTAVATTGATAATVATGTAVASAADGMVDGSSGHSNDGNGSGSDNANGVAEKAADQSHGAILNAGAGRTREGPILHRIFTLAATLSTNQSSPLASNTTTTTITTTTNNNTTADSLAATVTENEAVRCALWQQWCQHRKLSVKWLTMTHTPALHPTLATTTTSTPIPAPTPKQQRSLAQSLPVWMGVLRRIAGGERSPWGGAVRREGSSSGIWALDAFQNSQVRSFVINNAITIIISATTTLSLIATITVTNTTITISTLHE